MLPVAIREESALDETETQQLYAGLHTADPATQPRRFASLTLALRDEEQRLVGGLLASTVWNWLAVDVLWVDPALRGRGFGKRLMQTAEQIAITRGCTHARLDTFDFQARAFYERLGYAVYAQLDDFPVGHTQFHLRKQL